MKTKKKAKKVKNTKMDKSDFLSVEMYAPKDVWFGIRLSNKILEELKKAARKEKMAVQKYARLAIIEKLSR